MKPYIIGQDKNGGKFTQYLMFDPPGGLQPWPSDQQGQEQSGTGLGRGALYQATTRIPAITDRSTLEPFLLPVQLFKDLKIVYS